MSSPQPVVPLSSAEAARVVFNHRTEPYRQLEHDRPASPCAHVVFPRARPLRRANAQSGLFVDSMVGADRRDRCVPEESEFFDWLFSQAGLDARQYRCEALERRLAACLRSLRAASTVQARRILEQSPRLIDTAIGSLLIGVTSFFRDPDVFDTLARMVPPLAERSAGLHAWSMSCSDGAELYSVGMILSDLGLLPRSYLLGTDCRREVIELAKDGSYEAATLKPVTDKRRGLYFERQGRRVRIVRGLRQHMRWRTANVLDRFPPGCWDVILFRNTAMYLRLEALNLLWERIENALRPGGLLMLGKAERPVGAKRLVQVASCIYQRTWR